MSLGEAPLVGYLTNMVVETKPVVYFIDDAYVKIKHKEK